VTTQFEDGSIPADPAIFFTSVQVVSPKDPMSPNHQTYETSGSGAAGAITLNLAAELGESGDKVPQFKLQVNFLVPERFGSVDFQISGVSTKKDSRWDVVGDSPIEITGQKGRVAITMKQRDKEGNPNACSVVIAGTLRNGTSVSASLRIRIVTIARDLPKSQRDKP